MSYQFDYLIIQCDSINSWHNDQTLTAGIQYVVTRKQSGMDYTYICVVSTQRTIHEHPNAYTVIVLSYTLFITERSISLGILVRWNDTI